MNKQVVSASIVIGNTTTNPIVCNSYVPCGLAITGSVLGNGTLTFLGSYNGGLTYLPIYDETGTEVSLTAGSQVARAYRLDPVDFFPWTLIKIVKGTSASNVAQATYNVLIDVILEPI